VAPGAVNTENWVSCGALDTQGRTAESGRRCLAGGGSRGAPAGV